MEASVMVQARELYARWALRGATELGPRAWVNGRPMLQNLGVLKIGSDFRFGSSPTQSHIVVDEGGEVSLGDRVTISYGAAIHCRERVTIGADCEIGPFSVIHDSDFHVAGQRHAFAEPAPIEIGAGVKLGSRVTVMRATQIGAGATVLSGSVVSGVVEAGTTVGGVPARPVGTAGSSDLSDLPELVMRVLGLTAPPGLGDGPDQIAAWDSLGSLKLLLALEEAYAVNIHEEAIKYATNVGALSTIVAEATSATAEHR